MPTFTPQLVSNGSYSDGCAPGSNEERLWRYYNVPLRGINVMKYDDGSYEQIDSYPFILNDVVQGGKTVVVAYTGGHSYPVSASEAAALTAAGYGAFIT